MINARCYGFQGLSDQGIHARPAQAVVYRIAPLLPRSHQSARDNLAHGKDRPVACLEILAF